MNDMIEVYGRRRDGSDLAEAFLTLAGIPYHFIELPKYDEPGPDRERLLALNILGQVPTLRLPNGRILTETLAIAVYAQTVQPEAQLIPQELDQIPAFWRHAVMLVAAIYPTFTYGDNPAQWTGEAGAAQLRKTTEERCKKLWTHMEENAQTPYFLGPRMTALDLYVSVMTQWRPGPAWFEAHTPRLWQIQGRVRKDPRLQFLWS